MKTHTDAENRLLTLLRSRSVARGDFVLASGAHSNFYVDCKLTTLDPEGAVLVGKIMYEMISREAAQRNVRIDAVGGLTMGADPLALAIGIESFHQNKPHPISVFSVRKSPKAHGRHKLIEGNFHSGDHVVVIDDVVTRGESTLKAIDAVTKAGGHVEFVAVLVNRGEGGSVAIEARGYPVVAVFNKNDVIEDAAALPEPDLAVA